MPAHHYALPNIAACKYIGEKLAHRAERERALRAPTVLAQIAIVAIHIATGSALQNHHLNRLYQVVPHRQQLVDHCGSATPKVPRRGTNSIKRKTAESFRTLERSPAVFGDFSFRIATAAWRSPMRQGSHVPQRKLHPGRDVP